MVLAIVLCLSFMTTTSFAETIITEINIETNIDQVLIAGKEVGPLNLTVTDEALKNVVTASFVDWCRVNYEQSPPVVEDINETRFIDGNNYSFKIKLTITNPEYKFASRFNLNLDSMPCIAEIKDNQSEYTSPSSPQFKATEDGPELNVPRPPIPDPGDPGHGGPGGPVGPSETVKVIVDVNNDKGQKMTISFNKDEEFILPNALPYGGDAPKGKKLVAWEVNGERKEIGEKITIAEGMTLKAVWENKDASDPEEPGGPGSPDLVNITFIYGEGSENKFDEMVPKNEEIQLPKQNELGIDVTKIEGKELYAWLVNGERKEIGEKVKATEGMIIKALWKDEGAPDPETPTPTPTPDPKPPTPTPEPDPYTPDYYDYYDYYRPHRPHRPYRPAEDKKTEEKPEEKPIDKPANKIETEVIFVIGSNNMDTKINGTDSFKGMDAAPYIKNGRTMLPIRYIAEALGMSVSWDAKTRTVIIQDMFYTVEIPVDTNIIKVNGEVFTSDVKPEIVHGRTMMPIANIARALGLKDGKDIIWDASKRQVIIKRIYDKKEN